MAAASSQAAVSSTEAAGEKIPGTIVQVRGVPVLLQDQAAHAVRFGYFPISSTGFYSYYCRSTPSASDLEARAQEADSERSKALHRLRSAKEITARTPEERFSAYISLTGAITCAAGQTFLAPASDLDKLLREIATAAGPMKAFLEPGYAKPTNPASGWTPDHIVEGARTYHELCKLTCRLVGHLTDRSAGVQAWAAFVEALPKKGSVTSVPGVLRKLIERANNVAASPPAAMPVAPVQTVVAAAQTFAADKRGQYSLF